MKTKKQRIIELNAKGMSKLGISKKLGVSRTYVYDVLFYRTPAVEARKEANLSN